MSQSVEPISLEYASPESLQSSEGKGSSFVARLAMVCGTGSVATSLVFIAFSEGLSGRVWGVRLEMVWVFTGVPLGVAAAAAGLIGWILSARWPAFYGNPRFAILGFLFGIPGAGVSLLPTVMYTCCHPASPRTICSSNIRSIMTALKIYAHENDDQYPRTLRELVELGTLSERQLFCPENPELVYHYISGLDENCAANTPVVYEPSSNHGGLGGNIGFGDGHVEFCLPERYEEVLRPYRPGPAHGHPLYGMQPLVE